MIILVTVLIILAIIVAIVFEMESDFISVTAGLGAVVLGLVDLLLIGWCIDIYAGGFTAKEKVKMYKEENTKIEEQLNVLVKQYMDYESETLKEFKSESSITLITMYPELKSDTLVQNQINTYTTNSNKIKELKEQQINLKIGKWLLYFGG